MSRALASSASLPAARRRRPRALVALALVALSSAAAAPVARAGARTSLPAIERQVMCVTCRIPLNVAQSPQADRERAFIQGLIVRGENEAQIRRALVAQYGPSVLGLPRARGFDLAAYLVPLAAVLGLAVTLAALLPRWRRRTLGPAAGEARAAPLSAAEQARLEADLSRFD